jgi:hypothetical protein
VSHRKALPHTPHTAHTAHAKAASGLIKAASSRRAFPFSQARTLIFFLLGWQLVGLQRSTGIIVDLNIFPDSQDSRSPQALAASLAAQVSPPPPLSVCLRASLRLSPSPSASASESACACACACVRACACVYPHTHTHTHTHMFIIYMYICIVRP